jgi:hypothetical protein
MNSNISFLLATKEIHINFIHSIVKPCLLCRFKIMQTTKYFGADAIKFPIFQYVVAEFQHVKKNSLKNGKIDCFGFPLFFSFNW